MKTPHSATSALFDEARRALTPAPVDHEVIIVGAGFGGLGAAIQFKRLGVEDLVILDRDTGVGGTWHTNTYPGVAVDIASATYSYSFEPKPNWTRLYTPGAELKDYAEHVAAKYGLRPHLRFERDVTAVRWNEHDQHWTVELHGRPPLTTRILVIASGILSQPKTPDIPGLDSFGGTVLHTSRWPHGLSLAGQRVAIIGTGATAVQAMPEIANTSAHVSVFQRTAIWVTPKPDLPVPTPVRALFRWVPATQKAVRYSTFIEYLGAGLLYLRRAPWILQSLEALSRAHLRLQVRDPAMRAALTPDYNFFCKRPTFSNDYYRAFNRPNVEMVTTGIDHITGDGIVTADGHEHQIDALVIGGRFMDSQ